MKIFRNNKFKDIELNKQCYPCSPMQILKRPDSFSRFHIYRPQILCVVFRGSLEVL